MGLEIETFVLGPIDNNTYLLADTDTRQAVLIDPSFESDIVLERARSVGWEIRQIWLTHAHFDHIAGAQPAALAFQPPLPIGLHPGDLELWNTGGNADLFGIQMEMILQPAIRFENGQQLQLGNERIEVRHTPGHSPGHVVFVAPSACTAFCGDLVFKGSVGRTDLPGGSHATLLESIRKHILTLEPQTRLLSGHGPATTVADEIRDNPFLS
ncbi:MAG TPA: MBL fold metallo-hydrolase [Anaerolineaceae bacterium]|nr:MBL fold metallo-hydrolase [Anaerolineaceae bacterium]